MLSVLGCALLIVLLLPGTIIAASDPAQATTVEPMKPPAIKVNGVALPEAPASGNARRKARANAVPEASLGESIILQVENLAAYLAYASKQKKNVTLFLNGNDTAIAPVSIDPKGGTIQFRLERNADNKKIWTALLRDPFDHPTRRVQASVGMAGSAAPEDDTGVFTLVVVDWDWYATMWLILVIVLIALFFWLVIKYDILRDGPKPRPYSLGRCQMAWWFFLILIGYVMIWLITGDQDTITPSLLTLTGISAGTALGAVLIDSTDTTTSVSDLGAQRLALQAAQQNADQAFTAAQTAANAAPADPILQKNLEDARAARDFVAGKLRNVNDRINGIAKPPKTFGFLRDILSDSRGTVGLHRFQIVVWTVVLGTIFIVSVVTDLSMPEFSGTLLATMGISAGTYLGFKFPEK